MVIGDMVDEKELDQYVSSSTMILILGVLRIFSPQTTTVVQPYYLANYCQETGMV
jgi:phytoene/squalene synthetase